MISLHRRHVQQFANALSLSLARCQLWKRLEWFSNNWLRHRLHPIPLSPYSWSAVPVGLIIDGVVTRPKFKYHCVFSVLFVVLEVHQTSVKSHKIAYVMPLKPFCGARAAYCAAQTHLSAREKVNPTQRPNLSTLSASHVHDRHPLNNFPDVTPPTNRILSIDYSIAKRSLKLWHCYVTYFDNPFF